MTPTTSEKPRSEVNSDPAEVDGVTGLKVPVRDSRALPHALDQLRNDEEARDAMGLAAQQRAEEAFVPRDIWDGLDAVMRGEVS